MAALCTRLLEADPATRIVFTSRERLPAPFDGVGNSAELGRLSQRDALRLVEQVLAQHGWTPPAGDDGRTPEEVASLVEAVQGHARALVLLAPEVARRGVAATTTDLHGFMVELERRHPGQRENSLYASVELSLRRLPAPVREAIRVLAVFHDGAELNTLGQMLVGQLGSQTRAQQGVAVARVIAQHLVDVGLGEMMDYGYLRLDPALPPYLAAGLSAAEIDALRGRWAEAMMQLVNFLYGQQFEDAQLAAQLTLLELPNLLALLDGLPGRAGPEQIVNTAGKVEQLLANLGRPAALARAAAVREAAAREIGAWSHASFEHERLDVERLLAAGDLSRAYQAAAALQQRALVAGGTAYPSAALDSAMAVNLVGQVLFEVGQAAAALERFRDSQRRFEAVSPIGRMASVVIARQGDCLTALGRLDEAAQTYQEGIKRAKAMDDARQFAAVTFQLGSVRMLQERYADAMAAFEEARAIFERLGEPVSVATAWHQTGMVHRYARQFEAAERAYRQSLAIKVQQGNRAGQASSLTELGNLYGDWGRPEQAVTFYRQAVDIYTALGDQRHEGVTRSNIADTLCILGRTDEARRDILRAIECDKPFGHASEPWKTFAILHDIEQAAGNGPAAAAAWRQARDAYLAYRRDGGYAQQQSGKILEQLASAIESGQGPAAAQPLLAASKAANAPPWLRTLAPKLQAILTGSRDSSLADDLALDYDDSAELLLLLERLGG